MEKIGVILVGIGLLGLLLNNKFSRVQNTIKLLGYGLITLFAYFYRINKLEVDESILILIYIVVGLICFAGAGVLMTMNRKIKSMEEN